jgi:hypothetical protein
MYFREHGVPHFHALNDIKKIYDCSPLLEDDTFKPLLNNGFFKSVKADKHGYGISWTDELDISESELWLNGVMADCGLSLIHRS